MEAKYLRELSDLMERKKAAVEHDDLELAVKLKKDIAKLSTRLQPLGQQEKWVQAGTRESAGMSFEEMRVQVMAIDPARAQAFQSKYIDTLPSSSAPIDIRMRHCVMAVRSFHMILSTSGLGGASNFTVNWDKTMRLVIDRLAEGKKVLDSFLTLEASHQQAAKGHDYTKTYVKALGQVSEVGQYISTSCMEALLFDAGQVQEWFKVSTDMLTAIEVLFEMAPIGGRRTQSMDEVCLSAATVLPVDLAVSKICGLSLRPLVVCHTKTVMGIDGSSEAGAEAEAKEASSSTKQANCTEIYPLHESVDGVLYMRPLLQLWQSHISATLPRS